MKKMLFKYTLIIISCIFLGSAVLTGCGESHNINSHINKKGMIVVGSKNFTEQIILSKITSIYLREKGFEVEEVTTMGSRAVRAALEEGYVDLYWEYTGTGLMLFNERPKETDPEKAYTKVKTLDALKGLVWLDRADFNNTYTILMRKEDALNKGIKTLTALAAYVNEHSQDLMFGSNAEFCSRKDGLKGLEAKYGFKFPEENIIKMEPGLTYISLREKVVDVAMGFATDGRIEGFNLISLKDDKHFFPVYDAAPVVRKEVLEKFPEIERYLRDISSRLDEKSMKNLNYLIDMEHRNVTVVAREWLVKNGLIAE